MESDASVRELLKLIFGKKPTIPAEMAEHSSFPTNLLNEDFSEKLAVVLGWRKHVVSRRWNHFFDRNKRDMFSNPGSYLGSIMLACIYEHECNQNIFDSFISVCVLVSYLNEETFSKVRLDFRDLNPDIIMVFYRHVLKRSSLKREEFNRFVEYILGHKYLEWSSFEDNFTSAEDLTASVPFELNQKIKEELNRYCHPSDEFKSTMDATAMYLMQEIVSNTSIKLPTIPSEAVLIRRLLASEKMKKKAVRKRRGKTTFATETSHGNSSHNSDSKTGHFVDQQKDAAWYENIVEAVVRHNHFENSVQVIADNQIHEEASGILEHLESKIKSLIEVLDNCSEE